jgi:hypothetical protein
LNDDSKNINIVGFHPLESSLVVLGYGAIVFNLFFFDRGDGCIYFKKENFNTQLDGCFQLFIFLDTITVFLLVKVKRISPWF